jgi:cob(I)alamin adenosyltransferase
MKIYTKTGDKGKTQLLGGSKVKKNHSRLEAYGTIDELNAYIGNIFDQKIDQISNIALLKIQNRLFDLGSNIAYDHKNSLIKLQHLDENDVLDIEKEIDRMEKKLPILTNFILPSGHKTTSICHIARTVCRRAERNLVDLMQHDHCDEINIKYLNRLSDYLFVLARYNLAINDISEILWEKKK